MECPHGFKDETRCGDCASLSFDSEIPGPIDTVSISEVVEILNPKHQAFECPTCDGSAIINAWDLGIESDEEEIDCNCPQNCHFVPEPEKEKTKADILREKIESGEVKRVSARFTPGSTIHKETCPYCEQVAVEISREIDDNYITIQLECNHTIVKPVVKQFLDLDYMNITSHDGMKPYPFQAAGAKFLDSCNGRGLIADQMGLGKTIQSLIWLRNHPEAQPFMIVAKASLKINWYREILRWLGEPMIQIIDRSNDLPIAPDDVPGMVFKGYIISVDTLARADWAEDIETHDFIKTVIIDECQTIKNMNAKRTKRVRELCVGKQHIIALSGTPIKNNAAEYFPVLNILRPEKFYGFSPFCYKWVDTYSNGYGVKAGGIKSHMLDEWNRVTGEFIIRRMRVDVLPDLPEIMRSFQYHDLGPNVRAAYTKAFEDFMESCESNSSEGWSNTLAAMSRMRHLTGIAKVEPCVEHVTDFLTENVDEKITIFAHHRDVIGLLSSKLDEILIANQLNPCLILTGETPGNERQDMVDSFKENVKNRVMIASTLAAGEGLNLQFCSNCIMLERQWNPANEEQAEGRFSRIGSVATSIDAKYLVAIDTIDEFFARLVEQKRSFMSSTLDGKEYKWEEASLMKELANNLKDSGRKPWMMTKH